MPEAAARIILFFIFYYLFSVLAVRNYFYFESVDGELIGNRSLEQWMS